MKCFQIERDSGLWYSVEYSSFSLGPEADKYRLSISGFSGDVGDAMAAHPVLWRNVNGMPFTTPDQDNDLRPIGICFDGLSGWWFRRCARAALNLDTNGMWNAVNDVPITDVVFSRMMLKLD